MAEDEEESEEESEHAVELGEGERVEGAPLSRPLSRLHYGIQKSRVVHRVGDVEVRTPDGPRTIERALSEVDETYFPRKEDLHGAIRDVIGRGPVPTSERDDRGGDDTDESTEE